MGDAGGQAALAAAMQNIAVALQAIQNLHQPAPPVHPAAAPPLLDIFAAAQPFDRATRAGASAYDKACAPLDVLWDGTIESFPSFMIALRIRADEVRWNSAAPQGILSYTVGADQKDLLTEYHTITEAIAEAARAARNDARAIQNSRALYHTLKSSITGDLRATMFDQAGNLPVHEDGPLLLLRLTSFTMASSLQLSIQSFSQLQNLDPSDFEFNISRVNTKLNHLFVLATTGQRQLGEPEKIVHTLTCYDRIKQPEQWAQWVRNKVDRFEDGDIDNCQALMNQATVKYSKISSESTGFNGRSTTLQEDVVAMFAAKSKSTNKRAKSPPDDSPEPKKAKMPPFIRHYKVAKDPASAKYKVGDSKTFDNTTWYFCDCPTHRDRIKWHTFPAETCRGRKKWLSEGGSSSAPPVAQVGDANGVQDDGTDTTLTDSNAGSSGSSNVDAGDVTALLANALALTTDNSSAHDLIADALNAIHQG